MVLMVLRHVDGADGADLASPYRASHQLHQLTTRYLPVPVAAQPTIGRSPSAGRNQGVNRPSAAPIGHAEQQRRVLGARFCPQQLCNCSVKCLGLDRLPPSPSELHNSQRSVLPRLPSADAYRL